MRKRPWNCLKRVKTVILKATFSIIGLENDHRKTITLTARLEFQNLIMLKEIDFTPVSRGISVFPVGIISERSGKREENASASEKEVNLLIIFPFTLLFYMCSFSSSFSLFSFSPVHPIKTGYA